METIENNVDDGRGDGRWRDDDETMDETNETMDERRYDGRETIDDTMEETVSKATIESVKGLDNLWWYKYYD